MRSFVSLVAHAVWATERRAPFIAVDVDPWLDEQFGRAARDQRARLLGFGAAPDHVHVVVSFSASLPFSEVIKTMKGRTSRLAKKQNPDAPLLAWQDGYWAESWPPAGLAPLLEYIRCQRQHHARAAPSERWEISG